MRLILFFTFIFLSFLPSIAQSGGIVTVKTDTPTQLDGEGGLSFGMNEQKFIELSRKISAANPNFVGVKQTPQG